MREISPAEVAGCCPSPPPCLNFFVLSQLWDVLTPIHVYPFCLKTAKSEFSVCGLSDLSLLKSKLVSGYLQNRKLIHHTSRTRSIFSYLIGTSLFCYLALELTENEEEEGKNTGPRTRKPSDELVKAPFKEKFVAQDILGDVGKVGHKSRSNDETLENDDDDGEEDEDYDAEPIPEDALFIPVGFVHERPRTYYKGSDPEWQSFLEFSKDKKRKTHICSKYLLKYHKTSVDLIILQVTWPDLLAMLYPRRRAFKISWERQWNPKCTG